MHDSASTPCHVWPVIVLVGDSPRVDGRQPLTTPPHSVPSMYTSDFFGRWKSIGTVSAKSFSSLPYARSSE